MTDRGPLFIADTYVNEDPSAEQLADIAWMSVQEVQRFGLPPKVAFLSHSLRLVETRLGPQDAPGARSVRGGPPRGRMRRRTARRRGAGARHPQGLYGGLHLTGSANLLICPNIDAANILYNVLKTTTSGGVTVAPS